MSQLKSETGVDSKQTGLLYDSPPNETLTNYSFVCQEPFHRNSNFLIRFTCLIQWLFSFSDYFYKFTKILSKLRNFSLKVCSTFMKLNALRMQSVEDHQISVGEKSRLFLNVILKYSLMSSLHVKLASWIRSIDAISLWKSVNVRKLETQFLSED